MSKIILAFNIRQSVYRQLGLSLFQRAAKQTNMHLLPIITLPTDGIEQRAVQISQKLPQLLNKMNIQNAHIACYSSSGIDFRYAISQLSMDKYVKTLTTVSSPHLGSKLASMLDRKSMGEHIGDACSRLSGVGLRPFYQFVPQNMRYFNQYVKNAQNVSYYSLGAERLPNLCGYALSESGKYLFLKTHTNYQYHNDGVFGHDQVHWGHHVINFQADHGEVIGIYGNPRPAALRTVVEIVQEWEQNNTKNVKESVKEGTAC